MIYFLFWYAVAGLANACFVWWVHNKAVEEGMPPDDGPFFLLFEFFVWPISLPLLLYAIWDIKWRRK